MEKKKVGLMGGTFDPVHVAHLILAECAYRDFGLDEVIFIPNGDPPHKAGKQKSPASQRLEMLRIAVDKIPYFSVSDIEIGRSGYAYSSDTLDLLKAENPGTDYYFIMGGDSLFQIETWHEPAKVMASCHILACVRGQEGRRQHEERAADLMRRYRADIALMDIPALDISSSEIRERCRRGQSVRFMVPDGVDTYIAENGLYPV